MGRLRLVGEEAFVGEEAIERSATRATCGSSMEAAPGLDHLLRRELNCGWSRGLGWGMKVGFSKGLAAALTPNGESNCAPSEG